MLFFRRNKDKKKSGEGEDKPKRSFLGRLFGRKEKEPTPEPEAKKAPPTPAPKKAKPTPAPKKEKPSATPKPAPKPAAKPKPKPKTEPEPETPKATPKTEKPKPAPKKAAPPPPPEPEPTPPPPEPEPEIKTAPPPPEPEAPPPPPEPEPEPAPPEPEPAPPPEPEPAPQPEPEPEPEPEESGGWMARLRAGLGKTAKKISGGLKAIIGKPALDASDTEAIKDTLIMADLGIEAAGKIAGAISNRKFPDGISSESLADALADEITTILAPTEKPLGVDDANRPHVILMVGVNGSGKTTTAAKLAEYFKAHDKSVMMAAADTFRAAAVEQLQIWGERTGAPVITAPEQGGDAAAVAYRALEEARNTDTDILIIDTAGRLQAKKELMDELAKIHRVIQKQDATAPHDSIIVLDGTVGQNAISQVAAFTEAAHLTGMIVTKLDGSAHGGVVVALAEQYGLPIHAVGVGEAKEDLQPFEAAAFARALADSHTAPADEDEDA